MRLLAALLLTLALAAPALAQQGRVELPDVEDEVMCVSCNVPLFIAESPQADRQRALIRGLIDEGLTKEQIKARLVSEYGEDVLAMPEDDGVGLASKLVPLLAGLALLVGLALLLTRWRGRGPLAAAGAGAPPVATDAELRRVDEDVKRLG